MEAERVTLSELPVHHADALPAPDREVLTWDGFGRAGRELAGTIAASGYRPDIVVAVARGGLPIAGHLAYALGVKLADAINVEFYTDVEETLPDPVLLPPMVDAWAIRGQRVLVADDVADSGRTLALVVELLSGLGAEVRTAVLYDKPESVVEPDYSWRRTDRWIVFPWSAEPPLTIA